MMATVRLCAKCNDSRIATEDPLLAGLMLPFDVPQDWNLASILVGVAAKRM